jgi:hypothetical protein
MKVHRVKLVVASHLSHELKPLRACEPGRSDHSPCKEGAPYSDALVVEPERRGVIDFVIHNLCGLLCLFRGFEEVEEPTHLRDGNPPSGKLSVEVDASEICGLVEIDNA